jgi:hypothetical protein
MRAALAALAIAFLASPSFADKGQASFTPTSLLKPFRSIGLENSSNGSVAEIPAQCDPSAKNADGYCVAETTSAAAMEALFQSPPPGFDLPAGTYDQAFVSHCLNEGGYSVRVKGDVYVDGTLYHTVSEALPGGGPIAQLLTTGGPSGYVTVPLSGCRTRYQLPAPIQIDAGKTYDYRLFFDLNDLAWASLGPSVLPGGCRETTGKDQSVCMAYPDILPYIFDASVPVPSTAAAVSERYEIIESTSPPDAQKTGGLLVLLLDKSGPDANLLAGYSRRYFSRRSAAPAGNFDTPFKSAVPQADGTLNIETYGGSGSGAVGYLRFPSFKRADHFGAYLKPDNTTVPYYAHKVEFSGGCRSNPDPYFKHPVIDPAALELVFSPGSVGGGGTEIVGRSYMRMSTPTLNVGASVPVIAPTTMTLTAISYYTPGQGSLDWSLYFTASCEVGVQMFHLKDPGPDVKEAWKNMEILLPGTTEVMKVAGSTLPLQLATDPFASAANNLPVPVQIAAGSTVGSYIMPSEGVASWDYIVLNRARRNSFSNQARYEYGLSGMDPADVVFNDCPFDYYEDNVRQSYLSLIAPPAWAPPGEPLCRKSPSRDILGALTGEWFLRKHDPGHQTGLGKGRMEYAYGNPFPVALDTNGDLLIGHTGTIAGLTNCAGYRISANSLGLLPHQFTPGTKQCYAIPALQGGGHVFFKLESPTKLKVSWGADPCPADFPADGSYPSNEDGEPDCPPAAAVQSGCGVPAPAEPPPGAPYRCYFR